MCLGICYCEMLTRWCQVLRHACALNIWNIKYWSNLRIPRVEPLYGRAVWLKSFTQLTELGSCNERGAANFYKAWRRDLATLKTFKNDFEQVVRKTKEIINKTSTMKNLSAKSEFPNTPPTGCQHNYIVPGNFGKIIGNFPLK